MMGKRHEGRNVQTGLRADEEIEINTSYAWSAQKRNDLNKLCIPSHDGPAEPIDAPPFTSNGTTIYFRNIEDALVQHILEADAIVGCVAWLTNKRILQTLAQKDPVSIVVQKEDFLRPDVNSGKGWSTELRNRYAALSCSWYRWDLGVWLSTGGDQAVDPIRCVGNYNRNKHPAFPRMHHKFIVFFKCKEAKRPECDDLGDLIYNEDEMSILDPYAVWTGSFNFTENAGLSLENAIVMSDRQIAIAYWHEWKRVFSLSEPLDWESDWTAPEWRIGT